MKKPNEALFKLAVLGWIQGLFIEQRQTGTDTVDTFCKITGDNGKTGGLWRTYERYLDVRVGHNYIAKLKQQYRKELVEWEAFEKQNREELAEYERLKAKFDI